MSTREIKFRAWDDKYKRMLYDLKLWTEAEFNILNFNEWNDEFDGGYAIMQYTGLKDKNGKDIYEGDLCKSTAGNIFVVEFNLGCFEAIFKNCGGWDCCLFEYIEDESDKISCEIIGNMHENSELLEK